MIALSDSITGRLFTDAVRQQENATSLPRDVLHDLQVLVVDDSEEALELLAAVMTNFGAKAVKARRARRALEVIKLMRVNVVVSDLAMPEEDGLWLIEQIRHLPSERGGSIPVIGVTGHRHRYDPNHISEKGFEAYLTKPVDPFELVQTVARLVGR